MFGANPMGARRLWRLIDGLPLDSAFHRDIDPDGAGLGWDRHAHLLAVIAEITDISNAIEAAKVGGKYTPVSIPRPGKVAPVPDEPLTGAALEDSVAHMGGVVKKTTKKETPESG